MMKKTISVILTALALVCLFAPFVFAVLNELRRIDPAVPVVLVSGYSQAELAELLSVHALAGIVHKPFSYGRLREAMWIAVGGDGNLAALDSGQGAVDSDRTGV